MLWFHVRLNYKRGGGGGEQLVKSHITPINYSDDATQKQSFYFQRKGKLYKSYSQANISYTTQYK